MGVTRRQMLLTGLSLLATGCAARTGAFSRTPGPIWPGAISRPQSGGDVISSVGQSPAPQPVVPAVDSAGSEASLLRELGGLPRSLWTNVHPELDHINLMDGVTRITAHHEGSDPVYFTSERKTEQRLKLIQHDHIHVRGWADIGYHFVIDRDGRLWEARPIKYQGAHVKYHNKHNVGVMCLGNFMKQQPSRPQVDRLGQTLKKLMAIYQVPVHRVYTHRELMPTLCPGNNLQPHVNAMRRDGYLS